MLSVEGLFMYMFYMEDLLSSDMLNHGPDAVAHSLNSNAFFLPLDWSRDKGGNWLILHAESPANAAIYPFSLSVATPVSLFSPLTAGHPSFLSLCLSGKSA